MAASTYLTACLLPWQSLTCRPTDADLTWYVDLGDRREGDLGRLYLYRGLDGLWNAGIWFTDPSYGAPSQTPPRVLPQVAEADVLRLLARHLHPQHVDQLSF